MQTPLQWWHRHGWPARILLILITLYVLYALVGFFVLPGVVRKDAQKSLSELLGRPVTIGKVAINPLALSITVDRFSIKDPRTGTLAGFKQLYVNAEMWASLFHWRPWVGLVRLDGLDLRLRRAADGALNVDDVIRRLSQPGKTAGAKPAAPKSGPLPAFTIGRLSLTGGHFHFTDAAGEKPVTLTLPVAFKVDDFTSRTPDKDDNRYVLHVEGPDGGTLDWDGRFALQPLTTQGHLTMSKVDLVSFARLLAPRFYFRVPSGQLGLDAHYGFSAAPGRGLTVSQGSLTLRNLKIRREGDDTPSLVFPSIAVQGVSLDTAARTLEVPRVTVKDPSVKAVRDQQGLDLATLFLPKDPRKAARTKAKVKEKAKDTAKAVQQGGFDWRLSLDKLAITGARAALRDETLKQPADLSLGDGDLTVTDVKVGKAIQWRWQGSATVAGGQLQHSGQGQLAPLKVDADLHLKGLPLTALQPWIHNAVPLTVKSGRAGGDLKLAISGKQPTVSITGSAGLDGVQVEENGEPFVDLGTLNAKGLDVDTGTHLIAVKDLSADHLDFINRIDKKGEDSITRLAASDSGKAKAPRSKPGPSWRVRLGTVAVKNSSITHHDNSLSPPFQVALKDWDGTLKGFDTAAGKKAKLHLTGKVNGNAPLSATGTVSAKPLFVDLQVALHSYGMDNLTPYTGRYLGYKVQRGLLTVNSTVKIDKQELNSDTKVNADRFYLGDTVSSDQALSIPVKLSLAVLRDASGNIDLPLNMSGDMSDPSFSVAGLVFRVIRNILVKAATSPFSLLASLVGGQDLNQIGFPPAQALPAPETRQKLASLAEVLDKRPALKVVITGQAGAPDRQALARKALTDDLGGDWPGLDKALADSGWRNDILDQYENRFGRSRDTIKVSGQGSDAETERARQAWQQLMAAAEKKVDPKDLRALATQRAEAAEKTLTGEYKMKPDRISLGAPVIDSDIAGIKLGLDQK